MAENITTLLELLEAGELCDDDLIYIVHGSGSDRDRKLKLSKLRKYFTADIGKVEVFNAANGDVDLSECRSGVAVVNYEGSPTSLQPITLTVNGIEKSRTQIIFVIPHGAEFPLTVSVPIRDGARKEIALKGGSSAILTWFSYAAAYNWTWHEIPREPVLHPTPHDITLHETDSVTLNSNRTFEEIVPSSNIKVRKGIVDFTVQFSMDMTNQTFGAPSFWLQVYDDTVKTALIERKFVKPNIWDGTDKILILQSRFVFSVETAKEISIKAAFATQGGTIDIKQVNVTGFWIDQ